MSRPAEAGNRPAERAIEREFTDVWQALDQAPQPELGSTLWPSVAARVRRASWRRSRVAFTLTTAAAGLAGLLIGVLLGGDLSSGVSGSQIMPWSETGSLFAGGDDPSLVDVYLAGAAETDAGEVITP